MSDRERANQLFCWLAERITGLAYPTCSHDVIEKLESFRADAWREGANWMREACTKKLGSMADRKIREIADQFCAISLPDECYTGTDIPRGVSIALPVPGTAQPAQPPAPYKVPHTFKFVDKHISQVEPAPPCVHAPMFSNLSDRLICAHCGIDMGPAPAGSVPVRELAVSIEDWPHELTIPFQGGLPVGKSKCRDNCRRCSIEILIAAHKQNGREVDRG